MTSSHTVRLIQAIHVATRLVLIASTVVTKLVHLMYASNDTNNVVSWSILMCASNDTNNVVTWSILMCASNDTNNVVTWSILMLSLIHI